MRGREHGRESTGGGGAAAQTARLLRPLRRRAERIERPARVRMRNRNPCTLWRRRLFGWYVRLLTSSLRWDQERVTPGFGQIAPWLGGPDRSEPAVSAAPPAHAPPRTAGLAGPSA